MTPPPGPSAMTTATDGVAEHNAGGDPAPEHALIVHGNVATRMAIEVTVVRELTQLRALEAEWRGLAVAAGAGALFRGPDWLIPWWSAYHATLGAELHVLVGRTVE